MPIEIFKNRKSLFEREYSLSSGKYNRLSVIRVVLFIAFITAAILLVNSKMYLAFVVLAFLFPLLFGTLVRFHNRIKFQRDQFRLLALTNEHELQRLEGKIHDFDGGEEFKDELHPYGNDLDIFGRNSLFQLLSRATSPAGKQSLANWLTNRCSNSEITARQKACQELSEKIDWRQEFQALGLHDQDTKHDYHKLIDWVQRTEINDKTVLLKTVGIILPIITIGLLVLNLTVGISIYFFFGMLAINGLILKRFAVKVLEITEETNNNVSLLKSFGRLMSHIEHSEFHSSYLLERQRYFTFSGYSSAKAISKLQRILDFLNSRSNMFFGIIDLVLLADIHLVLSIRKWKRENAQYVMEWFEAIGEIEAISSLAGFAFANRNYVYPKLHHDHCLYQAQALGHPLIFNGEGVTNHFELSDSGKIAIVTGSNMSGKSTFLRTLGVNAVLAFTGAPCCATELELSNFQVFTSMRTQDNLEEHVSSFYAELKRLRQLLDTIQSEETPIFFLLDEILKGTNSKDRHLGSASLVRQLSHENAFGLVSTHDLELGELSVSMDNVTNYSFNSQIKGDEILFDYRLTDGICKSFNASKLMENMGIKIKSPEN
ncbi:MAG: DNA mismatch repair protein MutS [Bacteroidota bacterium]